MQLKNNEIKDIIIDYLKNDKSNQAILIDGEWGSGKTFFIKENIISEIKEKLTDVPVYYVSLYGISPNMYKIIITSGNVKIDYYKNFHIK